ncbi:MlaD family protein [Algiphilus sp. W345]|uniref:MlaD family protein n=1 Tax=Banduia mediterranea TaxID=3075609 RepID=A0ABU2WJ65_9GAMM|nr:MlaD family protein [Algiphilus sp. W345]MDT0497918.1 MlaD family protein [Algiphilus sp. W345]
MTEQDDISRDAELPEPELATPGRWSVSLVWLVPLVAALVGLVLVVRAYLQAGPSITITFDTAEGIEPGKTEVKYKDVVVGKVSSAELEANHEFVIVHVDLSKEAASLAVEDSRFWVVRPRVDMGGVSGLGTLLSGAYIGVDVGQSDKARTEFEGLEVPPAVTNDQQGKRFQLRSSDLGSLDIGSPVYYRRIPVGRVVGFDLNPDGRNVTIQVFVDHPYDRFVTNRSRFWNASGVDVSVSTGGVRVNTQSLATVLVGGVAFQSLPGDDPGEMADMDAAFPLFSDQNSALAPPDGDQLKLRMRFFQSVRGLAVGAPVDFQGIEIGTVSGIELEYDRDKKQFAALIDATVYPQRLGRAYRGLRDGVVDHDHGDEQPINADRQVFTDMVNQGLRAQMRTGNLISGQLYIALAFEAKAKPMMVAADDGQPLEVPTSLASFDQIQQQVADIVDRLDEIPFRDIGRDLSDTVRSARDLLRQIDGEVTPELRRLLEDVRATVNAANQSLAQPDAPLQQNLTETLDELDRAARSMRSLTDYLQRHPESLIRGKANDPDPTDNFPNE